MLESRLFFVDKLLDMGAQIIPGDPHRAAVIGLEEKWIAWHYQRAVLIYVRVFPADRSTGVPKAKSTIQNIEQIDRGYQNIDERLRKLGSRIIKRV